MAGIGEGEVKTITLGSLFDGIGGFPLAASRYGIKTLWASEIEPFPIKVTKIRFPNMKHLGDITKIDCNNLEPVDIVTGGSPCQDLSVAGKRAGLAGARSGLFMEQIRIVRELREIDKRNGRTGEFIRPRFMVWENVPGAFSSNKGEDVRAVLEETARIADETVAIPGPPKGKWNTVGAIMGNGWSIAWRVLDAQYWGVPQRRRRIFLVADFAGHSAGEILFKSESMSGDITESREKGQETSTGVRDGVTTAGGKRVTATITATYGTKWNGNSGADTGDHFVLAESRETGEKVTAGVGDGADGSITFREVAGTLRANAGAPKHEADWEQLVCQVAPFNTGQITSPQNGNKVEFGLPCHTLSANEHPPSAIISYGIQGSMIGRADKNGPQGDGINEDVSFTLNTTDRHAVAYGICSDASNSMKSDNPHSGIYEADTSRTIDQNGGNPACNQGGMEIVQTTETVLFEPRSQDGVPRMHKDIVPTLNTAQGGQRQPCIAQAYQETVGSLCARDYKGIGNQYVSEDKCIIAPKYSVRRLTPLECERLQGFPDGWTDIPGQTEATQEELEFWRDVWLTWDKTRAEDPEEVKPRTDKRILRWLNNPVSDSAQYKALGNSVAVPCPEYVLEGIKEVLEVAHEK